MKNNLTGAQYNSWKVLSKHKREGGRTYWLCKCSCGALRYVYAVSLRSGKSKSCGCYHREVMKTKRTHGATKDGKRTHEYSCWLNMRNRCQNKNVPAYANYGGRGITVCQEWQMFKSFLEDMGVAPQGYTLDRIDNNGNYCKENCHWVSRTEQGRNKRNNLLITYANKTAPLSEWCGGARGTYNGLKYHTIKARILRGMQPEYALTTPLLR